MIRKITLLKFRPYRVTLRSETSNMIFELPTNYFYKRLETGLYELSNPEAIPSEWD